MSEPQEGPLGTVEEKGISVSPCEVQSIEYDWAFAIRRCTTVQWRAEKTL